MKNERISEELIAASEHIGPIYLTEKEVSRMIKRALQSLRNDRFKNRGIPYVKFSPGRQVRYSLIDVVNFMESRKITPGS